MPYCRLYYHITWGTKDRLPLIGEAIQTELYRVITGRAQNLGASVHAVGGIEDHLHLVASVPPSISLSDFIGQIKGSSSHFVTHILRPGDPFAWQAEYGIVTFGAKQLDTVVNYVTHQRQHHAQQTTIPPLERVSPALPSP